MFQRFRHLPRLRDVLDGAFEVEQLPLPVAHGTAVLLDPNDAAVLAIDLRLEAVQSVVLRHQPHEFLAAARLHIQAAANVLDLRHQLQRRLVAVNAGEGDVGQQVMTVDCCAENTLDEVVENTVVIFLFLRQRQVLLLARNGAANGVRQLPGVELAAAKIFLGAAKNRLGQEVFVLVRPDDNHRQLRRLDREPGNLEQRGGVRLRNREQDDVKIICRHHRQAGISGRFHRHSHFMGGAQQQITDAVRNGFVAADQQNFQWGMFHAGRTRGKYNFIARLQARCGGQ